MPKIRPDMVRLAVLVHRKRGMNFEDFQAYWRDEHAKLFSSQPIVKRNILNYEQAHANADAWQKLKDVGWAAIEADGMAIFEARSYEKIYEVFTDEDFKKVMVPDEEQFMDRGKTLALPLDVVPIFDDPT